MNNVKMFRLAIFASGSGTNAEEIIKYFKGHPSIQVALLLSNNPQAYALERAAKWNVPANVFTREMFREQRIVLEWLQEHDVTHVVLAGFLWLVPSYLIEAYPDKIINIHPALLPRYGGKNMYGMKVHEAVKTSGDRESGITIHLVNEKYDEGAIIFQAKCAIGLDDSPEAIAQHVHQLEYRYYPVVIENWVLKKQMPSTS